MKYQFRDDKHCEFQESPTDFRVRSLVTQRGTKTLMLQHIRAGCDDELNIDSTMLCDDQVDAVLNLLLSSLTDECITEIANQRAKYSRYICKAKTGNPTWPNETVD